MKITREALKTIVKETMIEESEYQDFFKRALEKAGGSIPKMSEEEKKAFFNKIEKTWKGKGEKNEISETELEEAQSPAQKAAFAKMLAKKDGKDESVVAESFADPLEGFPQAYKDLLKKLQRSNDRGERSMLINKMNVIRKKLKLKPLTNESTDDEKDKVKESIIKEGFSTWEVIFDNMNLSGVKLSKKNKYTIKARNTVEAIKKAAKMAGVKDGQWIATKTHSVIKKG